MHMAVCAGEYVEIDGEDGTSVWVARVESVSGNVGVRVQACVCVCVRVCALENGCSV